MTSVGTAKVDARVGTVRRPAAATELVAEARAAMTKVERPGRGRDGREEA